MVDLANAKHIDQRKMDFRDFDGRTSLMRACLYGQLNVAKALMEGGARLDLQDNNGVSALMFACCNDHLDVAKALIKCGASLKLQDKNGRSTLMIACQYGRSVAAKALIEGGASLELQDYDGRSAVMYACQRSPWRRWETKDDDLLRCIKLCYVGGADLSLKNRHGEDALAIARRAKLADAVALLEFVTMSRVARILLDELQVPRDKVLELYNEFFREDTNFHSTRIGDAGARALARAIANDTTLTRLDLSDGQIGDVGAQGLAAALEFNETLAELDLRNNGISDKGASALLNVVERNSCLAKICLDTTTIIPPRIIECTVGCDHSDLQKIIDDESKQMGTSPEPGTTMATLDALAIAAEEARAASTRYHDFFDQALSEVASILATLDDPLDALRPFEDRMRAIRQHTGSFEDLQKAVIDDVSLVASRNQKRSEILEHVRSILADGLDARVAALAAYASPKGIQSACESAWGLLFKTPFELGEQSPTFEEVQAGGQAMADARKAWRARHDFTSLRSETVAAIDALDAQTRRFAKGATSFLSLRNAIQVQNLGAEMRVVEQAFRAELDALRIDDGMADAPLDEIRTALTQLAAFYAFTESRKASRWRDDLAFVTEQLAHLSQGSSEPDIASFERQLRSVRRARRTQERLQLELSYARDDAEAGDSDAAEEIARLEAELSGTTSIFKLDREVRRARADMLRHAETHYPELLHDTEWCRRIGIADGALIGVGKLNLWLGNVTDRDFEVVQELASRPGKTTKRVRDPAGRDLVLKRFHLGSEALYSHFYRQVQGLAEIDSAFVVRIEGLFTDDSLFGCILTPFYPGGDLAIWIRENPHASVETRKRIAVGILSGLYAVHQRNLVHCDIKPKNIFLTEGLSPVLGDFDGVQRAEVTMTRPLQTTIKYVAPELRDGKVERVGPAADLYSVGVVLKELFPDPTSNLTTLISTLCADDPAQRPSALDALHHEAFHSKAARVKSCVICLEAHPEAQGVSCADGHFTCNDCLSDSVQAASQPDAHIKVLRDGSMRCVSLDCDRLVAGNALAAAIPTEDFAALLRIVREHFERDTALEQERESSKDVAP